MVLTGERLIAVVEAREIGASSYRKTKQNLTIAFAFNGIGVPAAITGLIGPVWAMVAMISSVSLVLANSFGTRLRPESLLRFGRFLGHWSLEFLKLLRPAALRRSLARRPPAAVAALLLAALAIGAAWTYGTEGGEELARGVMGGSAAMGPAARGFRRSTASTPARRSASSTPPPPIPSGARRVRALRPLDAQRSPGRGRAAKARNGPAPCRQHSTRSRASHPPGESFCAVTDSELAHEIKAISAPSTPAGLSAARQAGRHAGALTRSPKVRRNDTPPAKRVSASPLETEVIRLMREIRRERMTVEGLRQGLDGVAEGRAAVEAENARLRDEIRALRAESGSKHDWSSLPRPSRAA